MHWTPPPATSWLDVGLDQHGADGSIRTSLSRDAAGDALIATNSSRVVGETATRLPLSVAALVNTLTGLRRDVAGGEHSPAASRPPRRLTPYAA